MKMPLERRIRHLKNMFLKRLLALVGLVLFLAVFLLIPIALYADSIYREAFDARGESLQLQQPLLSFFRGGFSLLSTHFSVNLLPKESDSSSGLALSKTW